jgi:hypothetical protein
MITMYVKEEIFRRVGMRDSRGVYKAARENYRSRFAQKGLQSAVDFVKSFNGFNRVSKFFWSWLLKADMK